MQAFLLNNDNCIQLLIAMKSNRSYCEDLNKQLAMYLAFRNIHGAAAVMRQLQGAACPVAR